jgi:hypothetical protein
MAYPRTAACLLAGAALLLVPAVRAQDRTPGQISGMGTIMPQTTQAAQNQSPAAPDCDSAVSFIDSAVPQSQVKLLFQANYDDRRPSRNEYLFPKSGVPGSPGWWIPERRVDWQDLTSYIEVAFLSQMSAFVEISTRWVNPDINPNDWGLGDFNFGVKWAFISTGGLSATLQLRGTVPTRGGPGLGTSHYSLEPGFLFYLRPIQWMALEGEARYWVPINGSDFSGDLARYGLGFSFGERNYSDFWFTPVVELIGWTMLGGKEMVTFPDGTGAIHGTSGETVVNAMAGVRFGWGDNGDIYIGYGRSLTGDAWQHDLWRIEFRVRF